MNTWWRDKAKAIQEALDSKEPNALYAGQRELQSIFLSRRKRPNKLRDKKGRLILTQPDRLERWREYFSELLNVPGTVKSAHFDALVRSPPSFAETVAAVQRLKNGKATGPDGIDAEPLKCLSLVNLRVRHEHIYRVWMGAAPMPEEWADHYILSRFQKKVI